MLHDEKAKKQNNIMERQDVKAWFFHHQVLKYPQYMFTHRKPLSLLRISGERSFLGHLLEKHSRGYVSM